MPAARRPNDFIAFLCCPEVSDLKLKEVPAKVGGVKNKGKVRWGILSTAEIGRKNWKAILNSGNGIVSAVASRDGERSRDFVALCQGEAAFEQAPQALAGY